MSGRKHPHELKIGGYKEQEIINTFEHFKSQHERCYILYILLLESRARVEHVLEMSAACRPEKRYSLSLWRGLRNMPKRHVKDSVNV